MEHRVIPAADFYRDLPLLRTRRLLLRPLCLGDAEDYFEFGSDPGVTQFLRWGPHPSPAATKEYLQGVVQEYPAGRDGPWGIELRENGKLVGAVHLMNIEAAHSSANIGIVVARSYWRIGLATESLEAVTDCVFRRVGLHRLQALCHTENSAACALFERVGFRHEGTLRHYAIQKGAHTDFHVYGLLASEPPT
jgi:ribosomal-protein-alanine N-acetyltransferase